MRSEGSRMPERKTVPENSLPITKVLTISTRHIKPNTAKVLENAENNLPDLIIHKKSEYGWWIHTSDYALMNAPIAAPDDLLKCMMMANTLGCEWLCLDRDGKEISQLPTFEWN